VSSRDNTETLRALGRDLVATAVLRGRFVLRSGATSGYYIDKYLFTTQPGLLRRIATELAARLPAGVQRLAGPVLGAVPLVTAVSLETGLPTVIVRTDKPKDYGTNKQIEGTLEPGERVLLVEDVVTTGGAALAAVDVLREAGADVLGALVVVDRQEGGAAAFAAHGVPFSSLFTKSELGL
jgi:orotate phosphoribosyltransferase